MPDSEEVFEQRLGADSSRMKRFHQFHPDGSPRISPLGQRYQQKASVCQNEPAPSPLEEEPDG